MTTTLSDNFPVTRIYKVFAPIIIVGLILFSLLIIFGPDSNIDIFLSAVLALLIALPFYFFVRSSIIRTTNELNQLMIYDLRRILRDLRTGKITADEVTSLYYSQNERLVKEAIAYLKQLVKERDN